MNEFGRQKLGSQKLSAGAAWEAVYSDLLRKEGTFDSPGLPPGGVYVWVLISACAIPLGVPVHHSNLDRDDGYNLLLRSRAMLKLSVQT